MVQMKELSVRVAMDLTIHFGWLRSRRLPTYSN